MARTSLSDFLAFKEMPPGRHVFALTQVRKVVEGTALADRLVPLVDIAIHDGRRALKLELEWSSKRKTKKNKNRRRPGAQAIKHQITRQLTSIYGIVQHRTVGDPDDPVSAQARGLLQVAFSGGVEAIARQPFEVMLGTLDTLLTTHFEGPLSPIEALGITREVERLKRLTEQLRTELELQRRPTLTYDEVEAARDAVHESTCRVIIAVLDTLNGSDETSARDRVRILAPLEEQQELVSAARAQHRQPLDVDPDTGEEIDPDDEGEGDEDDTEV